MDTHSSRPTDHRDELMQFYRELFAKDSRPAAPTPPRPARPVNPANPDEISTEEYFRQLFARAKRPAPSASRAPGPPCNPDNPDEISTAEYIRQLFAGSPEALRPNEPEQPARPAPAPGQAMATEDYFRELFENAQGKARQPLSLGPREGLEPPALPERFRRVRGGNQVVGYELLVDEHGRIAAKHENVAGSEAYFIYEYDAAGHLLRAWRDGRLAEEYAYDPRGARVASWNARDGQWAYGYDQAGRLATAGPWRFAYAEDGSLRQAWTPRMSFRLAYNQAGGISRLVLPGNRVLRCETVAPGLPTEKYLDAAPAESLTWRSPLQLATYRDHQRGTRMQFHYTGSERLPQAVTVQDAQGETTYLLGYDQVGSLKAVAAMDGENEGRVVKTLDYDAFGNVLADSNPALFLPLAFAGGLRDRFTGLVRFCHRDYDPTVGRFTAPDPLGDTGGDHDLYDYCVDEPVGRVDPEGTLAFLLPLAFLAGQAGATALGWAGVKGAAELAKQAGEKFGDNKLKSEMPQREKAMDKATTDAMKTATGINAGLSGAVAAGAVAAEAAPAVARGAAQAARQIPGAAAKAAEFAKDAAATAGRATTQAAVRTAQAAQNAANTASAAVAAAAGKGAEMAGKVKDAAVNVVLDPVKNQFAQDAITGALPGTPPASWGGLTGAATAKAIDEYDHIRNLLSK